MFAESSLWKIRLSPQRAAYGRGRDLTLSAISGYSPTAAIWQSSRPDAE